MVVQLWTDQVQRLDPGSVLVATRGASAAPGLSTAPGGSTAGRDLRVASTTQIGPDRYLVHFDGVDDRAAAEALRGTELAAEPIDVPGTLWVHELVGATVRDAAGAELGRIRAVEANPASDLLVLESGGLIPVRFVTAHDPEARTVDVDIPEGLLEP